MKLRVLCVFCEIKLCAPLREVFFERGCAGKSYGWILQLMRNFRGYGVDDLCVIGLRVALKENV